MKVFKGIVPALVLSLAFALPQVAWAASAQLTASGLEDGSESFSIANWNTEQNGKKSLSDSIVIELDEEARVQADTGLLTYNVDVWGSCDECRTMDLTGSVVFRDGDGAEIASWSDDYSEYDSWRQQHALSGTGFVPAGTASIEASVANNVGTKSDLELTGTLVINAEGVDSTAGNSATYNIDSFDGTGTFPSGTSTGHYAVSREINAHGEYTGDLRSSMTIFFGSEARQSIEDGIAFFSYYSSFTDDWGGHVIDCDFSLKFYDAAGNQLSEGSVSADDSLYRSYQEEIVDFAPEGDDIKIPAGTSYVKLEGRATVGTLSDLSSYMRFICYHEEWMRSGVSSSAPSQPEDDAAEDQAVDGESAASDGASDDEASDGQALESQPEDGDSADNQSSDAPVDETASDSESDDAQVTEEEAAGEASAGEGHPGIAEAEAEAAAAEEQAAASEAIVDDSSLVTPAVRLASAFTLLQTSYPDQITSINPNETITEETMLSILYVAKCIAMGESDSFMQLGTVDQLHADALSWAEAAGLGDLYESGVDTYAETIGVIRTYMGSL